MRRYVLLLSVFSVSSVAAVALAGELAIANADFEKGKDKRAEGWSWWSRTGDGSAEWTEAERHGGTHSVCVQHKNERDWAFSSTTRFRVESAQAFDISAWVRVKTGRVLFAAVAYSKGKVLSWDIGSAIADAQDKWIKLEARAEAEPPADEVYVRFVGQGETLAWVDDVAIAPAGPRPPPPPPKPKVEGYAKERVVERLDRGLVAVAVAEGKVRLSWRLLDSDPPITSFDIYRGDTKLNAEPITKTTDFLDASAPADGAPPYTVLPIVPGDRAARCSLTAAALGKPTGYISIPLRGKYTFQKVGIAYLDGDGKYDYVIKQPADNIDPYEQYWQKSPGTYKLEAYKHDGTPLWQYDMGWAIERGIWYSPYIVCDLDGDGKAEVICKAGEGDPRDKDGRVQSGPEYVLILDGMTGQERARADWISRDLFKSVGYNYASRNQLCVAYLDGKTPCLIVLRGTYNVMVAVAYEFHDNKLRELWRWDNTTLNRNYRGQGAHWTQAHDLDGDGRDEILLGSSVLDDNGDALWTTGLGHPDHAYLGDLDPNRPGLEIYYGIEPKHDKNSMCMVDAKTGLVLWGHDEPTIHIHSTGLVSDIDATYPGAECYSGERDDKQKRWLRTCTGKVLSTEDMGLAPRAAYWDADPQRELILGRKIARYKGATLEPRLEGSVVAVADVLGDWREEIVASVPGEMRIYVTPIPATDRRPCLMQDALYRNNVVCSSMGYYQIPMLSYDMASRRK
ncbi:MAG: silent information regulator protein Sir2 [Planctomycetota bacterium]|nr:silent information regulator protein Sir2 [Planctomycetota bacterium]